jgi:hypothetical protein
MAAKDARNGGKNKGSRAGLATVRDNSGAYQGRKLWLKRIWKPSSKPRGAMLR